MWPLTFDLVTPKSIQFIGSARYKHDLSLIVICLLVLMIMRSQAIFGYIKSPVTIDLWPGDPKIESFHWLCKIHTWPEFGRNPSLGSWDNAITSYFCIHNEPCDLVTPTSNQFIGSVRYIHDLSLEGIHQSVLEITRSRAIFAYIMSPVTFDLGSRDPKI